MNILIADDDLVARRILSRTLADRGEIDLACNGTEAWDAVEESYRVGRPYGLILLDIMMPGMDGHALLKKIRSLEATLGLSGNDRSRIAMATCLGDADQVVGSFRDECDGYIRKPFSKESVLHDLKNFGIL